MTVDIGGLRHRVGASLRFRARRLARRTILRDGTLETMWVRQRMNAAMREILEGTEPSNASAVEVSGDFWSSLPWASYSTFDYPAFDLVDPPEGFDRWSSFDVVICDQVLDHVVDPVKALRTLVRLTRPGGTVVVSTPFLIKIHPHQGDFWRFTPDGLRRVMIDVGLTDLLVGSWGNRQCVKANFRRWVPHRPWRSLRNEPDFPAVVWGSGTRAPVDSEQSVR